MLKIHHLHCGSGCPWAGRYTAHFPKKITCRVLLIETNDGLVLIDTGLHREDARDPKKALGRFLAFQLGFPAQTGVSALEQIEARGFRAEDVRHIIPTHLDFDHAGGLSDFPHAKIHLFAAEHARATNPPTFFDKQRYASRLWAHHPQWQLYQEAAGEPWFGFEAVRQLEGLPPEILLIPLHGHSAGHAGIAIQTPKGWILHAGDAYYQRAELFTLGTPPWLIRKLRDAMQFDPAMMRHNQRRLAALIQDHPDLTVFSAHDPDEA